MWTQEIITLWTVAPEFDILLKLLKHQLVAVKAINHPQIEFKESIDFHWKQWIVHIYTLAVFFTAAHEMAYIAENTLRADQGQN